MIDVPVWLFMHVLCMHTLTSPSWHFSLFHLTLPLSCKVVNPFFWFWRLPKKSVEALAAGESTHSEFRAANDAANNTHAQVIVIFHCFWRSEWSAAVSFSSH